MKYEVGDKVIIRKWDDMERQFGVDSEGDIKTEIRFVERMKEYCGKEAQIDSVVESEKCRMYLVKGGRGFAFSEDTFERVAEGSATTIAKSGMTFREKLAQEHPEKVHKYATGGCVGCPCDYGYESESVRAKCKGIGEAVCAECWNRVISEAKAEPAKAKTKRNTKKHGFKVGDHVRLKEYEVSGFKVGETGTIIARDGSSIPYEISRDGDGLVIWTRTKNIELVEAEPKKEPEGSNVKFNDGDSAKIVACTCGHKFQIGTIVKLKKRDGSYNATDKDGNSWFVVDKELAPAEEPKSKYFNGKVKCIRTGYDWWTVGKVYEIVDGILTADDGDKYPGGNGRFKSAEEARHAGSYENEFIPVEEEPAPAFTPHLSSDGKFYGNIGEATNYKDKNGELLYIGDVVELIKENGDLACETVIVKSKIHGGEEREKVFVMGIEGACDDEDGTTGKWTIIKGRSYEDVKNGEVIHYIKYVKEEE